MALSIASDALLVPLFLLADECGNTGIIVATTLSAVRSLPECYFVLGVISWSGVHRGSRIHAGVTIVSAVPTVCHGC